MVALVWLCFILHVLWPSDRAPIRQKPLQPHKLPKKRSKDPKPLAGLLHKPLCNACERAMAPHLQPPSSPPPVLTFRRGRKRTMTLREWRLPWLVALRTSRCSR